MWFQNPDTNYFETDGTGATSFASSTLIGEGQVDRHFGVEEDPDNPGFPNLRVDLSAATAATINQLRQSFQLQKLFGAYGCKSDYYAVFFEGFCEGVSTF